MKIETPNSAIKLPSNFNRISYFAMLAIGIFFLSIGNISTANSLIPVAMIFDPFDQTVTWSKRPIWQKAWLIVHLIGSLTLIAYSFFSVK